MMKRSWIYYWAWIVAALFFCDTAMAEPFAEIIPTHTISAQIDDRSTSRSLWQRIKAQVPWAGTKRKTNDSKAVGIPKSEEIPEEQTHFPQKVDNQTLSENFETYEYYDSRDGFRGVDYHHVIYAVKKLAKNKATSAEEWRKLLDGGITREKIKEINGSTYADPRPEVEIKGQHGEPKAQSFCEAVSNGLDALGANIGKFGKGIKEMLRWLEPNGIDRIDVYTCQFQGTPYHLVIKMDEQGQLYIQIQTVSYDEFKNAIGHDFRQGTVVQLSVKDKIPEFENERKENEPYSQVSLIERIRRRFAFSSKACIYTQYAGRKEEIINGFDNKHVILPTHQKLQHTNPQKRIHVEMTGYKVSICDNGTGMNAEEITRMFIPKAGTKELKDLTLDEAEEECKQIMIVQDKSLEQTITFSRNEEGLCTIPRPESIIPEAVCEGSIMFDGARCLKVLETRDGIKVPVPSKTGARTPFTIAVNYMVDNILLLDVAPEEKLKIINTLFVGLFAAAGSNDESKFTVGKLCGDTAKKLEPIITALQDKGHIFLPHERGFAKLKLPEGKKPFYIHPKLLIGWQGAHSLMKIFNVKHIETQNHRKIIVLPFTDESLEYAWEIKADWSERTKEALLALIDKKDDGYFVIPAQIGGAYLQMLYDKRKDGLNAKEKKDFEIIVEFFNIQTADVIETGYNIERPEQTIKLEHTVKVKKREGGIDDEYTNKFLTGMEHLGQGLDLAKPTVKGSEEKETGKKVPRVRYLWQSGLRFKDLATGDLIDVEETTLSALALKFPSNFEPPSDEEVIVKEQRSLPNEHYYVKMHVRDKDIAVLYKIRKGQAQIMVCSDITDNADVIIKEHLFAITNKSNKEVLSLYSFESENHADNHGRNDARRYSIVGLQVSADGRYAAFRPTNDPYAVYVQDMTDLSLWPKKMHENEQTLIFYFHPEHDYLIIDDGEGEIVCDLDRSDRKAGDEISLAETAVFRCIPNLQNIFIDPMGDFVILSTRSLSHDPGVTPMQVYFRKTGKTLNLTREVNALDVLLARDGRRLLGKAWDKEFGAIYDNDGNKNVNVRRMTEQDVIFRLADQKIEAHTAETVFGDMPFSINMFTDVEHAFSPSPTSATVRYKHSESLLFALLGNKKVEFIDYKSGKFYSMVGEFLYHDQNKNTVLLKIGAQVHEYFYEADKLVNLAPNFNCVDADDQYMLFQDKADPAKFYYQDVASREIYNNEAVVMNKLFEKEKQLPSGTMPPVKVVTVENDAQYAAYVAKHERWRSPGWLEEKIGRIMAIQAEWIRKNSLGSKNYPVLRMDVDHLTDCYDIVWETENNVLLRIRNEEAPLLVIDKRNDTLAHLGPAEYCAFPKDGAEIAVFYELAKTLRIVTVDKDMGVKTLHEMPDVSHVESKGDILLLTRSSGRKDLYNRKTGNFIIDVDDFDVDPTGTVLIVRDIAGRIEVRNLLIDEFIYAGLEQVQIGVVGDYVCVAPDDTKIIRIHRRTGQSEEIPLPLNQITKSNSVFLVPEYPEAVRLGHPDAGTIIPKNWIEYGKKDCYLKQHFLDNADSESISLGTMAAVRREPKLVMGKWIVNGDRENNLVHMRRTADVDTKTEGVDAEEILCVTPEILVLKELDDHGHEIAIYTGQYKEPIRAENNDQWAYDPLSGRVVVTYLEGIDAFNTERGRRRVVVLDKDGTRYDITDILRTYIKKMFDSNDISYINAILETLYGKVNYCYERNMFVLKKPGYLGSIQRQDFMIIDVEQCIELAKQGKTETDTSKRQTKKILSAEDAIKHSKDSSVFKDNLVASVQVSELIKGKLKRIIEGGDTRLDEFYNSCSSMADFLSKIVIKKHGEFFWHIYIDFNDFQYLAGIADINANGLQLLAHEGFDFTEDKQYCLALSENMLRMIKPNMEEDRFPLGDAYSLVKFMPEANAFVLKNKQAGMLDLYLYNASDKPTMVINNIDTWYCDPTGTVIIVHDTEGNVSCINTRTGEEVLAEGRAERCYISNHKDHVFVFDWREDDLKIINRKTGVMQAKKIDLTWLDRDCMPVDQLDHSVCVLSKELIEALGEKVDADLSLDGQPLKLPIIWRIMEENGDMRLVDIRENLIHLSKALIPDSLSNMAEIPLSGINAFTEYRDGWLMSLQRAGKVSLNQLFPVFAYDMPGRDWKLGKRIINATKIIELKYNAAVFEKGRPGEYHIVPRKDVEKTSIVGEGSYMYDEKTGCFIIVQNNGKEDYSVAMIDPEGNYIDITSYVNTVCTRDQGTLFSSDHSTMVGKIGKPGFVRVRLVTNNILQQLPGVNRTDIGFDIIIDIEKMLKLVQGEEVTDENVQNAEDTRKQLKALQESWKDTFFTPDGDSLRDRIIAELQAIYMPLIQALPEEIIDNDLMRSSIDKSIARHYREVEQYLKEAFKNASTDERRSIKAMRPIDIPYIKTLKERVDSVMIHLPRFMQDLNEALLQEKLQVSQGIKQSVSLEVIRSINDKNFDPAFVSRDTLWTLSLMWPDVLVDNGQNDASATILSFFQAMQDALNGVMKYEIATYLSAILERAVKAHDASLPVMLSQMQKILHKKPAVRDKVLQEMYGSFKVLSEKGREQVARNWKTRKVRSPKAMKAAAFVQFLLNDADLVRGKRRVIPEGIQLLARRTSMRISQLIALEESRDKSNDSKKQVVMDMAYLKRAIEDDLSGKKQLPDSIDSEEDKIMQDVYGQRESGAYTAEITQNSFDATRGMLNGELVIDFYKDIDAGSGKEIFVEEATDNGTGALQELALLIPRSTKSAQEQMELTGFFGTGKYTILEGVDKAELITNNGERAYMYTLEVRKDANEQPLGVFVTEIKTITDTSYPRGVTVRRIKYVENTIPEIDALLAKDMWVKFAGLAQHENFTISIVNEEGVKEPLVIEKKILAEARFVVPEVKTGKLIDFGDIRIIRSKDVSQQVVDKIGLRVCDLSPEYLKLIPAQFYDMIDRLDMTFQIPLPLFRGRHGFQDMGDHYLPHIQKYIAILFYRAMAYMALTQTKPQFIFPGFSLDWETEKRYDHLLSDAKVHDMALSVNKANAATMFNTLSYADMEYLASAKATDNKGRVLQFIALLDVAIPQENNEFKTTTLLARRKKVQDMIGNGEASEKLMRKTGSKADKDVSYGGYPMERLGTRAMAMASDQKKNLAALIIKPEELTPKQKQLLEFAKNLFYRAFGLDEVYIVQDEVDFLGCMTMMNGKRTMLLNKNLANRDAAGQANCVTHEMAHIIEQILDSGVSIEELAATGFVAHEYGFSHDVTEGPFSRAMRYAAMLNMAALYGERTSNEEAMCEREFMRAA